MMNKLLSRFYNTLFNSYKVTKESEYRRRYNIHKTVKLNYIENIWLSGNVEIGANTYINGARIVTGPNSKIKIGEWCAIGHNVNIIAWTHDAELSTGPMDKRPTHEKSIVIGNHVWIGTNVFIKEGIVVGNNAIIAANSIVTKDVDEGAVVGGVPARTLKYKKQI